MSDGFVTDVGAAAGGLHMSRTFGEWPPPEYQQASWPFPPFSGYQRTSDGRLVPIQEHNEPLARGKSFGLRPKPLAPRNAVMGVPRVPATGSRAVVAKGS